MSVFTGVRSATRQRGVQRCGVWPALGHCGVWGEAGGMGWGWGCAGLTRVLQGLTATRQMLPGSVLGRAGAVGAVAASRLSRLFRDALLACKPKVTFYIIFTCRVWRELPSPACRGGGAGWVCLEAGVWKE